MRKGYESSYALRDESIVGNHLRIGKIFRRQVNIFLGLFIFACIIFAVGALATWNVSDPSFSHATLHPVTNAFGYFGAIFSDLAIQFFGLSSVVALLPAVFWGVFFMRYGYVSRLPGRAMAWLGASLLFAAIASCLNVPQTWPMPIGLGGVLGDMVLRFFSLFLKGIPQDIAVPLIAIVLFCPAILLGAFASNLIGRGLSRKVVCVHDNEENTDGELSLGLRILGACTHWVLSTRAMMRRMISRKHTNFGMMDQWNTGSIEKNSGQKQQSSLHDGARVEPNFEMSRREQSESSSLKITWEDDASMSENQQTIVSSRGNRPSLQRGPGTAEAQSSSIKNGIFEMPQLHFLTMPKAVVRSTNFSQDSLKQNAQRLEGVLEDFGVRGEIIHVRPGPIVTLYELEPAPGIKSSRVISLSDDIARSMSAVAARVAVVPGRNAIGIELPNIMRETVYLREILASRDFEQTKTKLALALGKTIKGEPVIADLTKMPHLLVAGTTGSGKSVAINTMILSLLYRMTPQECRLIMIDPKMLELSVYDGIPHLLTPVVTDPKKAVVALKWIVREMEDRYRKMSKMGVRNIDGFNQRVDQAQKKGEPIARTVQTGFDRNTGEAVYETEEFDLELMPYIVVIIDEMADLMMVAGKDIEGAVQRLAQMARAAGIHVIMATQRPSVDVITGTIKANFPTRISFQVTSKIDSRTILGEQGAEQLLGQGDMLFMAGGGRIQRVHGPFVGDNEVEKVVQHLKLQGSPEYLDAITEETDEDADGNGETGTSNLENSADPYDQAVAVILRDKKVSTSYIQRRLGIGYNRAASIIERMEKEGIVSSANHAGKREILVPTQDEDF